MKDNPARPSYSSSVLARRAVDFSIVFFLQVRGELSPLCPSKLRRQLLPDLHPAALLISTGELLHFPFFPLVLPLPQEILCLPEPPSLQCTHHLQILAQNEHSKQDFEKCSEAFVSEFTANTVSSL